ncbi:MAG: amidase family protein, partial [Actinomycetota bacterium]|nr:amidase family protein [Actinomycetota bacterium]
HQTYNELFGTTNNPWDVTRSPGGSSGGAAVAVATGMTGFELGSDIANSIRGPASHCGIYGHKSTYGIVPYRGHIPPPPGWLSTRDITVVGPMGRSAADLGLVMSVVSDLDLGHEIRHLTEFRIAAWLDDETFPVAPDVVAVLETLVEELESSGVKVDRSARPAFSFRAARSVFNALLVAASLPEMSDEEREFARANVDDDGPTGTWARNVTMTHGQWVEWNEKRAVLCAQWADFFTDFDVLLTPAMPVPAIHHDQREELSLDRTCDHRGVTYRYFDQSVWAGLSGVAYLPSTVAPAGLTDEGLPVGVQIVGPHREDHATIAFARSLADVAGGYEPPPMARL